MSRIIQTDCPWCGTSCVGFAILSAYRRDSSPATWASFAKCGYCGRGSVAIIEDTRANPAQEGAGGSLHSIAPEPPGLQAPRHTPVHAARFYEQALDNLQRKNWDAAAAMLRKTLENSLKERFDDPTSSLYAIIKKAADNHDLTPDLAKWADQIRLGGNKALHEGPFSPEDACNLRVFTELVLTYLFTLPGMLQQARGDSD